MICCSFLAFGQMCKTFKKLRMFLVSLDINDALELLGTYIIQQGCVDKIKDIYS